MISDVRTRPVVLGDVLVELGGPRQHGRGALLRQQELCDLAHLAVPAISLVIHARQRLREPAVKLRLAELQLLDEALLRAVAPGAERHRRAERLKALGDARIRHLQRRRVTERRRQHARIETQALQRVGFIRNRTRHIKTRARPVRPRRSANDRAIEERQLPGDERFRDRVKRLRRDRVAIDEDRLLRRLLDQRQEPLGGRAGRRRRHDREEHLGFRNQARRRR